MPEERALEVSCGWYESHRSATGHVNTNVMTVGIAVAELMRSAFPLTESLVKSRNQSQVRGLSRTLITRVLREFGVNREFTSEGGRTSRGSLVLALELANLLNDALNGLFVDGGTAERIADSLQDYFVQRICDDYFGRQKLHVEIDSGASVSAVVAAILEAARLRSDQPAGTVAQHLVGAKLELRFPDLAVGRDRANAADLQTGRQGDFQLGDTAFHVTMAPSQGLLPRVNENIAQGYRPVILVPEEKVAFAVGLCESEGLASRVGVQSIETFVGTNVEEMGAFSSQGIRRGIAQLVRCYNERISDCESDSSLRIEEPEWICRLLDE